MPSSTENLMIAGGIGIAAFLFRKDIEKLLGLGTAPVANPVAAAQNAAAWVAASGATPVQQAVAAQQASTTVAAVQVTPAPTPDPAAPVVLPVQIPQPILASMGIPNATPPAPGGPAIYGDGTQTMAEYYNWQIQTLAANQLAQQQAIAAWQAANG
jgi:hypothetical protein